MNYRRIYDDLIYKRKNENVTEGSYFEYHHIKPKSIYPELALDKENIVKLSGREHFIAHLLLRQIYKEQFGKNSKQFYSMNNACWFMSNANDVKVNSHIYEKLRIDYAKSLSIRSAGKNNPMYGKNIKAYMSEEKYEQWRRNSSRGHMRENLRQETLDIWHRQRSGKGNSQYGVKPVDRMDPATYAAWKQKQSDIRIGEKNPMFGKSSWEKCSGEERQARIEKYKRSMKGKTNKGKRCMRLPGDTRFKMVKPEDVQKYLDLGYEFYTKRKTALSRTVKSFIV